MRKLLRRYRISHVADCPFDPQFKGSGAALSDVGDWHKTVMCRRAI